MANEQNLRPITSQEMARKLQERSVKKRKENQIQRKTFREELLIKLAQGDTQNAILDALLKKASKGDVRAFETLRDSIGEKIPDRIEQTIVNPYGNLSEEELKKLADDAK